MAINKIVKNSITGDAIDATKIADDAISEEHLDNSVIIGNTELAEVANSGDIFLVYDTSAGTLKKILSSNVGITPPTFTSVSPTNVLTGDGTGNATIIINGTNFDANVTAKKAKIFCNSPSPPKIKAPTRATPEIAFAPDINGVWRVLGTLEISSSPRYIERIRTKPRRA